MAKIVIIGNSAAGFSCTETLVKHSLDNEITVISQGEGLPYRRVLLIDYLSGKSKEEELYLCPPRFYEENKIRVLKGSKAIKVDARKQLVALKDDNNKIGYDYLVISTGKKIEVPDIPGNSKDGVYAFYHLADMRKASQQLMLADTICLTGDADFCLRFSQAIASKGKHIKIVSSPKPESFVAAENIEWLDNLEITEIIGEGAELKALKLNNGKAIGTSLILFAGSLLPATEFLKESGIMTEEGYICVNLDMRTNVENIFSCGSVSKIENQPLKPKTWDEAAREGAQAASSIIALLERRNTSCPKY